MRVWFFPPALVMHLKRALLVFSLVVGSLPQADAKPFACPYRGGALVFGQETAIDTLDPMIAATSATRDAVLNMHEALMTRDENGNPILELAETVRESLDHLTYTFTLRPGIVFHNGKPMTARDVAASFDRHARLNGERSVLASAAGWEAPDALTFLIHMKEPRPVFLEILSGFATPLVIIPEEQRDVPAGQLTHPIGTGPFQLSGFIPGVSVTLKRHDGYTPNTAFENRTGFGGYKQACLDSVTFRFVPEPGARAAGLKSGELHAVDDLPVKALPGLRKDPNITLLAARDWWIQIAIPNLSAPPVDNVLFRRAAQAALDMDEIMEAAADGHYSLNAGFQYPNQPGYSSAGKETYNLKDPALARRLLTEAGYGGEPVILLTNKDFPPMYNAALVVQQQLQAVGINARMKVVDWRTSVRMAGTSGGDWHFFFTRWGLQPALGPLATMRLLTGPDAVQRPGPEARDADLLDAWNAMNTAPEQADRLAAFARMQSLALTRVYAIPFGAFTKTQATRATVKGFVPFRVPRLSNVWFTD